MSCPREVWFRIFTSHMSGFPLRHTVILPQLHELQELFMPAKRLDNQNFARSRRNTVICNANFCSKCFGIKQFFKMCKQQLFDALCCFTEKIKIKPFLYLNAYIGVYALLVLRQNTQFVFQKRKCTNVLLLVIPLPSWSANQ